MSTRTDSAHTAALPPAVDCVVIGGGPVGLLTAIMLGQSGMQVSVIERQLSRYPLPRACTIDHEALRILQSIGFMAEHEDLFEAFRTGGRGGYEFRNGTGELLHTIDWNRPSESGWPNTNGFYQPDLEGALEELAVATPGVRLHRGWAFRSLTQGNEQVVASLASIERPDELVDVQSRWLVGADGANSAVRTHLGIGVGDSGFEADWLVVDYKPLVEESWTAFVTQYCDPKQPATAVNSGPGRRRFEFMRTDGTTVEQLGKPETAWELMKPWGVTPDTAELERHAVYTFRGRWAESWRHDNAFLAGDAAHLMPPFLGQGLCAGLRDAQALSWRLSMIHSGQATSVILDSYGPERTGHVREIIDAAVAAGRMICELDVDRAATRDAALREQSSNGTAEEPPHPRLGEPSLSAMGHPAEGRLAPQGRVQIGNRVGLFDDLVGGSWQLISRIGNPADSLTDEDNRWFHRIGGVLSDISQNGSVKDSDGVYAQWFAAHDCEALLARPDYYVFAAGTHADVSVFIAHLRSALEPVYAEQG
ncbi:bifunctional 3-(3-hydroxy-phenyl)propionate/3-hydroxycinnamic acid hydroxylase [Rhodococcus sp. PAMC28707]|uniref:bifunctional 3-(3-hydroxy-phenyl)propionate/3-hydroxycinnamic acid hydroxylase MhpA n=1 Tax=unclassified Rhodococcus (in: high G+C Gram-positive bacteria) TaxID=192944 RepID=UPI00109D9CD7|nr:MULTISPECIES: bifunctional 3-(3-hydroxy-phenyl)propionate/3-hydroxycinnamic acid hydroxylase [unclassified Rhodococcus (in: high G+C Gram-positive bacteria)]QCB51773.1 bifunctional 3-(3-hydroxy-phenyl)propionate/3-hydroxycinnamic acid hydroxylase [Rhodococcus sp. PAMC28705]QCB60059.1 bifunctional 3-(3-hydroxy-phenyl)propionate/3-hydroxycinnamic acid hydroxylase [Rhodococcus sp. PAMC28707]